MPALVPIFVLAFVLSMLAFRILRKERRRAVFRDLAAKYNLEIDPRWEIAPDPGIRGFILSATYSPYLQGRNHGVPLVAFDYNIGFGRGRLLGSGAGVQRRALAVALPWKSLVLVHRGDWTFLYTQIPSLFRGRQLQPVEIERLWDALLQTPGDDGEGTRLYRREDPGELGGMVIRPAKRRF